MKYLVTLSALLFALTANTQSLATQTGEKQSLYNAICVLNNIIPGDITMTEFRVLAQVYAKSQGLSYELYEFNGGNNLYILYYSAENQSDDVEYMKSSNDRFEDDEYILTSNESSTLKLPSHFATIAKNLKPRVIRDTIVQERVIFKVAQNVPVIEINTLDVDVVDSVELIGSTCDCENKTDKELMQLSVDYHRLASRYAFSDPELAKRHKDYAQDIDVFRAELRKSEKVERKNEKLANKDSKTSVKSKKSKGKVRHVSLKRRGANDTAWQRFITGIFPNINC